MDWQVVREDIRARYAQVQELVMNVKDKLDVDKDRWDLLPTRALREVVRVFAFGAKKYSDHGWKTVPGARERYYAALLRHVTAWFEGERIDSETGLPHLAQTVSRGSLIFCITSCCSPQLEQRYS